MELLLMPANEVIALALVPWYGKMIVAMVVSTVFSMFLGSFIAAQDRQV